MGSDNTRTTGGLRVTHFVAFALGFLVSTVSHQLFGTHLGLSASLRTEVSKQYIAKTPRDLLDESQNAQLLVPASNCTEVQPDATASADPTPSPTSAAPTADPTQLHTGTTVATRSGEPWTPLVQHEIIPESLQEVYEPKNLAFNVTRSMLRRSRPVVGNVQRLHTYLQKLQDGKCTNIFTFGGSVTAGHNVGGPHNSYPRHFIDWLNAKYPCVNATGQPGLHEHYSVSALSSQHAISSWQQMQSLEVPLDLVIIEYNVNDVFINSAVHALEDKGEMKQSNLYASAFYGEMMLRRLLLLRKPDPLAIVFFQADYRGRDWMPEPYSNPTRNRKQLFRGNNAPVKYWLATTYEIPMISANVWLLPLATKLGIDMQHNKSYPFSTNHWHTDPCCHPRHAGHRVLALTLAYALEEERKVMQQGEELSEWEYDLTTNDDPFLRLPMYLSQEEEDLWVQNSASSVNLTIVDFQDPTSTSWRDALVANEGWDLFADNRDKDKFGLITNSTADQEWDPHVAFRLTGEKNGMVEASFIGSYENFGNALMWTDQDPLMHGNCTIDSVQRIVRYEQIAQLNTRWTQKVSVPIFVLKNDVLKAGEEKILHFCLMKPSDKQVQNGESNKFKLLVVRLL